MTDPGAVRIASALVEAIVAQAVDGLPNEVCGILAGTGAHVTRVLPIRNAAASPQSYEADPEQLLAAYEVVSAAGLVPLGVYHSHPASPARPSATDIALAGDPDALWLIVSLEDPAEPDLRAWRVRDGEAREVPIATTDD